jgi:ribosomal protein L32
MLCEKCGIENDNASVFCNQCGSKLKSVDTQDSVSNKNSVKNTRKVTYAGEIHKCPNCGENIKSFETVCSSCGHEIRFSKGSKLIDEFSQEYKAIESKSYNKSTGKILSEKFRLSTKEDINKQLVNLIKNFHVPNNAEDLFEFLIFASSNIDLSVAIGNESEEFDDYSEEEMNDFKAINNAWIAKAAQVYQKAYISSKNHPKFLDIESIYHQKINAIENAKLEKTKKKKTMLLFSGVGLIVLTIALAILIPWIIKNNEVILNIKDSAEDYIGRDYNEVLLELRDAGFVNISVKEIEISPSDTTKFSGEITQITINNVDTFEAMSEFSSKAKIEITHYVIKYKINIRIEFEANLMFSKYDVNLLFNDTKKETLLHGKDVDLEFRINAGSNKIVFEKVGDSSVNGSIILFVTGDVDVTYKISASRNKIDVSEVTTMTSKSTFVQYRNLCQINITEYIQIYRKESQT